MRRSRPALAVSAALLLAASAAPALAATTTTPATGAAQSTLTLLDVALGGHTVSAGQIAAVASNTSSRVAQLVVTPAVLDGHGLRAADRDARHRAGDRALGKPAERQRPQPALASPVRR